MSVIDPDLNYKPEEGRQWIRARPRRDRFLKNPIFRKFSPENMLQEELDHLSEEEKLALAARLKAERDFKETFEANKLWGQANLASVTNELILWKKSRSQNLNQEPDLWR